MRADCSDPRAISILYVDDEPGLLDIGKIYLEKDQGIAVDTCECVDSALLKLSENHFDVIISDYQMPGKDGIEFLKLLREDGNSIPFIIFTGKGRQEVVIEALNNGADFYVQKGGDVKSQFADLMNKVRYAFSRKQAESALLEQNQTLLAREKEIHTSINRLNMAQSIGQSGCWEYNLEKSTIWGSKEGWRIFGFPAEPGDLPVDLVESCIPERERVHQALVDLIAEGKQYDLVYDVYPADGSSMRTVNSIAQLEKDGMGNPVRVVGVIRDISREMATERLLSMQSNAMNVAVDGIAILGLDGSIMYCNPSLARMHGYKTHELQGQHYSVLLCEENMEEGLQGIINNIRESGSYRSTSQGLRKDGSCFPQDISLTALEEGGFILIVRDISKLKSVEDQLIKKSKDLETINDIINAVNRAEDLDGLLSTIFDMALTLFGYEQGGIYLLDKDGRTASLAHHNIIDEETLSSVRTVPVDRPPFSTVLSEMRPIFSEEYHELHPGFPYSHVVSIPLTASGQVVGALNMASDHPHLLKRQDKESLASICSELGTSIHRMLLAEETRQSADNLQNLFEHLQEMVFITDTDGDIMGINRTALERLSYRREELIGKNLQVVHPPHLLEEAKENFRKVKEEGLKNLRLPLISKDGSIIESEILVVLGTWNGQEAVIGLCRDITARLQLERILKDRDAFNTSILENIPEYILIYRQDGSIAYVNNYAAREFGYESEELIGKSLLSLVPDDLKRMMSDKMRERSVGWDVPPYEAVMRNKAGEAVPVLIKGAHLLHNGERVNLIIMVDISARIRMEEELRRNEEHYRNLYQETPLGYQSLDENGCFKEVNDAWLRIMGYERDEVIGRSFAEFITPEYREQFKMNFPLFKELGETTVEFQMLKKDGGRIFVKFDGRIGHDHFGHFRQTHCIMDDISERKRYEEALQRTNKKLQLLSSITRHDINNQLTVLQGYATLMRDESDRKMREDCLHHIDSASNRIRAQIDFTRLYDRLGADSPIWHNVSQLLTAMDDSDILDDRCSGLEIFADPMVKMVFENLLDNTWRHGKDVKNIRMEYRIEDGQCLLSYCDDGIGVASDCKEAIFQRGYGSNTGLGLFLIREILDITGIKIVENGIPGKGARFEMHIPAGVWRLNDVCD